MKHSLSLQIGPVAFRIGSAWRAPIDALARLYSGYPEPGDVCDFSVRLEPEKPWRRWLKPSVAIHGDYRYCLNATQHLVAFTEVCLRGLLTRAGLTPLAALHHLDGAFTKGRPLRLRLLARKAVTPQG